MEHILSSSDKYQKFLNDLNENENDRQNTDSEDETQRNIEMLEGTYEHKTRRQMIKSNVEEEHSVSHVVAANNKEGWHSDVSGATGPVENFPIVPIHKNVELAIKIDMKWTEQALKCDVE